ncbi:Nn.00g000130.m01.CDS01 [Neocucurbitaria sp. VM-36]
MLEKQEATVEDDEQDGALRLPVSLSGEINIATRTLHTILNRLITSRLPLALPPHTTDPSLYATGLVHFAHIFLTFESLWADILRDYASPTSRSTSAQSVSLPVNDVGIASPPTSPLLSYLLVNPYDSPSLFTSTLGAPLPPSPQLAAFLQTLRPKGLVRSGRLKKDLEFLLDLHPTDLEVLLAKYPGDKVADFCAHIRKSVNEKPWTLVSYAWCFYMAVFSGGRWIRAGLLRAPPGFWPATREEETGARVGLEEKGLSFWHFVGAHDGEDIKAAFKASLAAAEELFTPDERVDIIEEAKSIFQLCATLVDELDDMVATDLAKANATELARDKDIVSDDKQALIEADDETVVAPVHLAKSSDSVTVFLRRPEVTGTLVALGCLACITLLTSS